MSITTWRRPAAVVGAAVLASALPLLASTGPAVADTPVQKTVAYSCDLFVSLDGSPIKPTDGPLTQDNPVKVGVSFTAPDLTAGTTIPRTPVAVDLDLGVEDGSGLSLHFLAVNVLGGKFVTGSSTDAALELRANGTSKNYPIEGLSVTDSPIPQDVQEPWIIPIDGSSPTIPVPDASSVDLLAPSFFTVPATIISTDAQGEKEPRGNVRLDCTAVSDDERLLATVSVADAPDPDPTDDPTTDPTDEPTAEPTTDPTDDPTAVAGAGGNGGTSGDLAPAAAAASNDALPNTGAPEQLAVIAGLGAALVLGGGLVARRRTGLARHRS